MFIFIAFKEPHIQCHVSNNFDYIVKNIDKWKRGKDNNIYPFKICVNTYKLKDTMIKTKENLYVLLYSEDKGIHYDVYAVSTDYVTLSRLAKSRKGSAGLEGFKYHYYRIIRSTHNYYDPSIVGDQKIDTSYLEEVVGMVEIGNKKFDIRSRDCQGYIIYDENGDIYATCDNWQEVREELEEAKKELQNE